LKYIFLTNQFYIDYQHCTEIEQKVERPYVQVYININGVDFAVPFRSEINHPHVLWTDKENKCGLDFSKAVVIEHRDYIDTTLKPYIRPNEHAALIGKEFIVISGLLKYIERYKKAKTKSDKRSKQLLQYSTLQYFEKYL